MKDRSGGAVCHRPTVVIELDIPYLIEGAVKASARCADRARCARLRALTAPAHSAMLALT
jgi:hypothetical protein